MLIHTYMGRRPTTSAMAGTVSGRRQMNSTARLRPGSRSRTQAMVGSSRASMAIEVIAASCNETVMAVTRSGVVPIADQASRVRGALMPLPRVENSNIAPIGSRKNAPMTSRTVVRKSGSLKRRDRLTRSPQPSRRSALEQGVQHHHDCHDHDHRKRQRFGEAGLSPPRLADQQLLNFQRHDDTAL